uniref:Peroxisomal membrane protein 2 n=1 Tax=Laticauda laticaudata TaxID=8630 RepID=A0A8C5SCQ9_LATLA
LAPCSSRRTYSISISMSFLHLYIFILCFLSSHSAFLSALGSLLSQLIEKSQKKRSLDWREPLRFATYGFLVTGPLSHYFYLYLEQLIPSDTPFSLIKRLLVDRLIVSPAFLALFFLVMNFLEVGEGGFCRKFSPGVEREWRFYRNFTFFSPISG